MIILNPILFVLNIIYNYLLLQESESFTNIFMILMHISYSIIFRIFFSFFFLQLLDFSKIIQIKYIFLRLWNALKTHNYLILIKIFNNIYCYI